MTQQNNEFEKWATKHIVSKRLLEFNTMKYENGMYKSHIMQRKFEAWQAGKADSERQPTDERLLAGCSRAEWHDKAWALFQEKTFSDTMLLKVNLHTIRAVFDATYDAIQSNKALASTPAQTLQAHDDEVIERVVKELNKTDVWHPAVARAIRALKGK